MSNDDNNPNYRPAEPAGTPPSERQTFSRIVRRTYKSLLTRVAQERQQTPTTGTRLSSEELDSLKEITATHAVYRAPETTAAPMRSDAQLLRGKPREESVQEKQTAGQLLQQHWRLVAGGAAVAIVFSVIISDLLRRHEADTTIQRARFYLKSDKLTEAKEATDKLFDLHVASAEAYALRGICASRLGDQTSAIDALNHALHDEPTNPVFHIARAQANLKAHNNDAAIADATEALKATPESIPALAVRAAASAASGNLNQSLADCDKCLALKQDLPPQIFATRAYCLYKLKRYDAALRNYDAALKIEPDNVEFLASEATCLKEQKKYEEAIGSCNRAIAAAGKRLELLQLRASCLLLCGKRDAALRDYKSIVDLAPEVPSYRQCADLAMEVKDYDLASQCYAEVAELLPDDRNVRALKKQADSMRRQRPALVVAKLDELSPALSAAFLAHATYDELMERGGSSLRQGNAAAAATAFGAAAKKRPDSIAARHSLSLALLANGETEAAFAQARPLAGGNALSAEDTVALAEQFAQRGDPAAAVALLEPLVASAPRNFDARCRLIESLLAEGRNGDVISQCQRGQAFCRSAAEQDKLAGYVRAAQAGRSAPRGLKIEADR